MDCQSVAGVNLAMGNCGSLATGAAHLLLVQCWQEELQVALHMYISSSATSRMSQSARRPYPLRQTLVTALSLGIQV
jgi:hypothetical protein